jgi:hypothetical protein
MQQFAQPERVRTFLPVIANEQRERGNLEKRMDCFVGDASSQ